MIGLPTPFANTLVCLFRKDELISFPEITVTLASLIRFWNLFPKFAAGCLASITDDKGYDLASPAAHDRPNPAWRHRRHDHISSTSRISSGSADKSVSSSFGLVSSFFYPSCQRRTAHTKGALDTSHTRTFLVG